MDRTVAQEDPLPAWMLTREEYFNDPARVRRDVTDLATTNAQSAMRFKTSYEYLYPTPGGPFKGSLVLSDRLVKGDHMDGLFGRARVVRVSVVKNEAFSAPVEIDLFEAGKAAHRNAVIAAVAAGEPVPISVRAEYPHPKISR